MRRNDFKISGPGGRLGVLAKSVPRPSPFSFHPAPESAGRTTLSMDHHSAMKGR
jgi:hypothetical protein